MSETVTHRAGKQFAVLLLLTFISVVIALTAMLENRWQDEFHFVQREYPKGFRNLVLNGSSSRPQLASWVLVGLGTSPKAENETPISDICRSLFDDPTDPVVGPSTATVTVVEFFDYQCPYCRKVSEFLGDLQANDPRVRLVFKEWPILGDSSELAARAALAAERQGRYRLFHQGMMSTRGIPTEALIRSVAVKVGIDADRLFRDAKSDEITVAIERNAHLAKQLGFIGTPSFVVGRTIVEGAITRRQFEKLIDLEIETALPAAC